MKTKFYASFTPKWLLIFALFSSMKIGWISKCIRIVLEDGIDDYIKENEEIHSRYLEKFSGEDPALQEYLIKHKFTVDLAIVATQYVVTCIFLYATMSIVYKNPRYGALFPAIGLVTVISDLPLRLVFPNEYEFMRCIAMFACLYLLLNVGNDSMIFTIIYFSLGSAVFGAHICFTF